MVTAENSPTLVSNPKDRSNLAVAYRVDRPTFGCGLSVSSDGGASWNQVTINAPSGHTTPCFGPDAAFGPDGTVYVSFTSFGNLPEQGTAPDAVWVESSTDDGKTLGQPTMVSGALAFQVRIAADPATPRRLVLSWVQVTGTSSYGFSGPGNPIAVSTSDDAGATWTAPVRASAPSRARLVAPTPLVANDLYVAFLDVGNDRLDYEGGHGGKGGPPYDGSWSLVVARSTDGGTSWQESVADQHLVPAERFLQLFVPTPAFIVSGTNMYLAYTDARLGDADVYVWRSNDRGVRWSGAVKVNDTRTRDGKEQYRPALSAAPSGRLDVIYYDRRADPNNSDNGVSLQSSFNEGLSFSRSVRLSDRPFSSQIGFGSENQMPDLGSRLGLVSTDAGALAVWSDTRNGTPLIQKQLLARGFVSISRSEPSLRAPLRIGGLVALAFGVSLVCVTHQHRPRRRRVQSRHE